MLTRLEGRLGAWKTTGFRSGLRGAVERLRRGMLPFRIRHVSGPRDIGMGSEELAVVCLVRDGAEYLPAFLQHYRALGAKHIALLDNGSTDGTVELAGREPEVTVLQTRVPYRHYKNIAKRYLGQRFGRSNWVLCVDIDEFFDYPYRKRLPLPDLLRYLNRYGYNAVVAQLLDLFPRSPLAADAACWQSEHRYYDLSGIEVEPYRKKYRDQNRIANEQIAVYHGGIRQAGFGVRPMLTKHPLRFPPAGIEYDHAHNVNGAKVADFSAVLLHYKYVGDFIAYAQRAVREQNFYQDSREYRGYLDAIERNPELGLYSESARALCSVEQLVEQGFLVVSDPYLQRAEAVGMPPTAP